jgi:hypothetical protein
MNLRQRIIHLAYRKLHTASVTWRKANEETKEVPATTLGVFAVHKSLSGVGWTVTHITSGKVVWQFKSSNVAKAFTEALIAANPEIASVKLVSRLMPFGKSIQSLARSPVQSWQVLDSFDSKIRYTPNYALLCKRGKRF